MRGAPALSASALHPNVDSGPFGHSLTLGHFRVFIHIFSPRFAEKVVYVCVCVCLLLCVFSRDVHVCNGTMFIPEGTTEDSGLST